MGRFQAPGCCLRSSLTPACRGIQGSWSVAAAYSARAELWKACGSRPDGGIVRVPGRWIPEMGGLPGP